MMEDLTACFTLGCLTLEGLRADLVTSLEVVGKSQVEEHGHALSNFEELDTFKLSASGMKKVQQMKIVHF